MPRTLLVIVGTVLLTVVTIATVLATISDAIDAIDWACSMFGPVPVSMVGAFIAGATITHAVDRGLAARQRVSAPEQRTLET
jgi:hypothetical protein